MFVAKYEKWTRKCNVSVQASATQCLSCERHVFALSATMVVVAEVLRSSAVCNLISDTRTRPALLATQRNFSGVKTWKF